MNTHNKQLATLAFCILLVACGGESGNNSSSASETLARTANLSVLEQSEGVTPFIKTLVLGINDYTAVSDQLECATGSVAKHGVSIRG